MKLDNELLLAAEDSNVNPEELQEAIREGFLNGVKKAVEMRIIGYMKFSAEEEASMSDMMNELEELNANG